MKKKLLTLFCTVLIASSLTACGEKSGDLTVTDVPETEVGIDGKNSDDITGFTYLYDYGNGFRLYADNYTKIVYVMYYGSSGSGAKSTTETGLSPWLSQNGKYCYIDTEDRVIKELSTDDTVDFGNNENEDDNSNTKNQERTDTTTEEGKSSKIDQSITDKINQNSN